MLRLLAAGCPLTLPTPHAGLAGSTLFRALGVKEGNGAADVLMVPHTMTQAVLEATVAAMPGGKLPLSEANNDAHRLWRAVIGSAAPSVSFSPHNHHAAQRRIAAMAQKLISADVPVKGAGIGQLLLLALSLCPGAARHMLAAGADVSVICASAESSWGL